MKKFVPLAIAAAVSSICNAQHHATLAEPGIAAVTLGVAKDVVPDFAASPDLRSVKSGAWSDPSTWDGARVPADGECAMVSTGHTVTLQGSTALMRCIGTQGTLRLQSGASVRVVTLLNYATGAIEAGTAATPVSDVKIEILDRPLDLATDPLKFGGGIISFGDMKLHGAPKTAFVRVKEELKLGATQIVLESAPSGWRVGDRLLLPDSRQYRVTKIASTIAPTAIPLTIEEPMIAAINGNVITLAAPLTSDHPGARDADGKVLALPHVGNLTRSIAIKSENVAGTRGHVMMTDRADIDIRYTGFYGLGRTLASSVKLAGNQIGRYPVHFHHLMGPRNPTNTGYQYQFVGNVMEDCRKWCAAIHNTHWGKFADNVMYKADGNGVVTEEGNERGNEIIGNYVVRSGKMQHSTYKPVYGGVALPNFTEWGWEGSCFWFTGIEHIVKGNVAANCKFVGYNINARAAAGFAENHPKIPRFRGADMAIAAEWDNLAAYRPPRPAPAFIEMKDNEVYASTAGGWFSFQMHMGTVGAFRGWNLRQYGMYAARNRTQVYEDFWLHSDRTVANTNMLVSQGVDINGGTYETGQIRFNRLHAEGFNIGITTPISSEVKGDLGPVFETVSLRNTINLYVQTPAEPQTIRISDVTFTINPWGPVLPKDYPMATPYNIAVRYAPAARGANVIRLLRTVVTPRGSEPFEVFATQQNPSFVMPERLVSGTRSTAQNCPTPGLTNAQCWAQHGIATFGQVATCIDTRPDVRGYVCKPVLP